MGYPQTPGFKEHSTSKEAATLVTSKAAVLREKVLAALEVARTADEVADVLSVSILSVRPRVSELHRDGRIEKTGDRRKNASGMSAHVWQVAA
jgi:predicted ArsR family transcriptional regulator